MDFNVFENEMNLIKIDQADETTKYIGLATCGSADDDENWKIIKETLDNTGNLIKSETYKKLAKWEDREELEF